MHDPFRQARGSRGVHEEDEVFARSARLGLLLRSGLGPCFVVLRAAGGLAADLDPILDIRLSPLAEDLDVLGKFRAVEEHGGSRIGQDEFEFVGDQSPIQGDVDGSDLRRGKEALDELHAIHHQEGHAITLRDAEMSEGVAHPVAASIEFRIAEAATAGGFEERLEMRVTLRPSRQESSDIFAHCSSLLCFAVGAGSSKCRRIASLASLHLGLGEGAVAAIFCSPARVGPQEWGKPCQPAVPDCRVTKFR